MPTKIDSNHKKGFESWKCIIHKPRGSVWFSRSLRCEICQATKRLRFQHGKCSRGYHTPNLIPGLISCLIQFLFVVQPKKDLFRVADEWMNSHSHSQCGYGWFPLLSFDIWKKKNKKVNFQLNEGNRSRRYRYISRPALLAEMDDGQIKRLWGS